MRKILPNDLERGRIRSGAYGSDPQNGAYGAFMVRGPCAVMLKIIASGAADSDTVSAGWEHVSISTKKRCPTWAEMCFVKDLFWEPEECAVQYHPPRSDYVNNHPFVLHLFRHKTILFPMPPSILVGVQKAGLLTNEEAQKLRAEYGL